jgi:S1-C subfamily serine protease
MDLGLKGKVAIVGGGSMGIGFAIPVSTAKQVMEGIVRDGQVTRGWIGVEPNDLTPELAESFGISRLQGVVVTGVLQNGPAFKAGVRPGDVLLGVDGKSVENVDQLLAAIAALKPGVTASLSIERGGSPLSVSVNPAQRPKQRPVDR